MQKILFYCFLLVLISSCGRKVLTHPSRNTPYLFKINAIKTENLSEEITGNDELQLFVWLVKQDTATPAVLKEWQTAITFDRTELNFFKPLEMVYSFENQMFKDITLVSVLIESDTERSIEDQVAILRQMLEKARFLAADSLHFKLNQAVMDDDLLGISFLQLSALQQPAGEITFSGTHLFDRYRYKIRYRLEQSLSPKLE